MTDETKPTETDTNPAQPDNQWVQQNPDGSTTYRLPKDVTFGAPPSTAEWIMTPLLLGLGGAGIVNLVSGATKDNPFEKITATAEEAQLRGITHAVTAARENGLEIDPEKMKTVIEGYNAGVTAAVEENHALREAYADQHDTSLRDTAIGGGLGMALALWATAMKDRGAKKRAASYREELAAERAEGPGAERS